MCFMLFFHSSSLFEMSLLHSLHDLGLLQNPTTVRNWPSVQLQPFLTHFQRFLKFIPLFDNFIEFCSQQFFVFFFFLLLRVPCQFCCLLLRWHLLHFFFSVGELPGVLLHPATVVVLHPLPLPWLQLVRQEVHVHLLLPFSRSY